MSTAHSPSSRRMMVTVSLGSSLRAFPCDRLLPCATAPYAFCCLHSAFCDSRVPRATQRCEVEAIACFLDLLTRAPDVPPRAGETPGSCCDGNSRAWRIAGCTGTCVLRGGPPEEAFPASFHPVELFSSGPPRGAVRGGCSGSSGGTHPPIRSHNFAAEGEGAVSGKITCTVCCV